MWNLFKCATNQHEQEQTGQGKEGCSENGALHLFSLASISTLTHKNTCEKSNVSLQTNGLFLLESLAV